MLRNVRGEDLFARLAASLGTGFDVVSRLRDVAAWRRAVLGRCVVLVRDRGRNGGYRTDSALR